MRIMHTGLVVLIIAGAGAADAWAGSRAAVGGRNTAMQNCMFEARASMPDNRLAMET